MPVEVQTERVKKQATPSKNALAKREKESFKKLKDLECFPEIDMRIKAGISLEEVARWMQEDVMAFTDIQSESLKRQLYRYKASLPPSEILKANEEPLFIRKAIEKMKRGIDEIEELEKLYLFQLRRISMDGQTEQKINKLFKSTNKEIELATTLLEKIVKIKMELGILDKQPQRLEVGGIVGHVPIQLDQMDERTADKTMTRMGLVASRVFKSIEKLSLEENENVIDAECETIT